MQTNNYTNAHVSVLFCVSRQKLSREFGLINLGGLAEFERELIIARTDDGRKRAQARGVRFGRPPSLTPHQRQEALQRLQEGETQADVARSYAVSQATISRLAPGPFDASVVA